MGLTGKILFDPEKHCGGKNNQGLPCTKPRHWGVPKSRLKENIARGNYRCKFHGGCSTGARTPEGKERSKYNALKSGVFAKTLVGAQKLYYDELTRQEPSTVNVDFFYAKYAALAWVNDPEALWNGVKLSREGEMVREALKVLVEQEQISEEFAHARIQDMLGMNLEKQVRIANQLSNLATQSVGLDRLGDARKRAELLQSFWIFVMKNSQERGIKEEGLSVLQRLKLELGIPTEDVTALLDQIKSDDDEEESEEFDDEEEHGEEEEG